MDNQAALEKVNARLKKGEGWIGYRNASTTPSKFLYYAFYVNGKQKFINAKTNDPEVAYRMLLDSRGLVKRGATVLPSEISRIMYEHLRDGYFVAKPDQANNGRIKNHLDTFFGGRKIVDIDTDLLHKYVAFRRNKDIQDPTIRRELSILHAMFEAARKAKKISHDQIPSFPELKDSEPAGQYIYPEQFNTILAALPTKESVDAANLKMKRGTGRFNGELLQGHIQEFHDLRPFFRFLYGTGCRVGAARKITWKMVRKNEAGEFVIDLPAEIMKTRKALSLTITGQLLQPVHDYLKNQFRVEDGLVFDSTNLRDAWGKACAKAGLRSYDSKTKRRGEEGGARLHDCRCSGAINMLRAGVDESTVLKIGGWKTRKMLDRYNVMDEFRIAEGLRKGGDFTAQQMVISKT